VPSLSIAQLLTPMTAAQVRSNAVSILTSLGLQPNLWAQGGIASSTLTVASNIIATLTTQLSSAISAQWNPTASGGDLQLLSQYVYGNTPPQATFATGAVVLTNIGGFTGTYGIGQATFGSSVANSLGQYAQYTNTSSFTVVPGSSLSPSLVTVPIECTTVGSAGNAQPGFVSLLVTQMLGVSCTNPNPVLGSDGLTDPQIRQLNTNSLGVRGSNFGPRSAYAYAIQTATNVISGLPVNVNRWSISISSHTGQVTIFVASPAGPVITSDLQGISNSIERFARPDGITVLPGMVGWPSAPGSASTVSYAPAITCYVVVTSVPTTATNPLFEFLVAAPTAASLQTTIVNALEAWFAGTNNPIGGLVASDDLLVNFDGIFEAGVIGTIGAAVANVPGCYLQSTRFSPPGDLALNPGEVAVWGGTVNVIIQYVS
jgi:Baseplate J-like protein